MKTELILTDIAIRQDGEGRYCLNDLHKAAGNNPNQKPSFWLRTQQTKDLIIELSANLHLAQSKSNELSTNMCLARIISDELGTNVSPAPVISYKGGKTPGVYAIKDMVYAYAMWISPEFHLHVIQIYDALVTTTKTPEQIYRDLANELRLSLPDLKITERAVLISDNKGQVNMSGETREQLCYFKEMDKFNLPGIIAVTRKPYKVMFDWFNKHKHDEETRESVYQALSDRCAWYKSIHQGYKPFKNRPGVEEVHGIKTGDEASQLAADLARIVADLLAEKSGKSQPMQRLIGT